MENNWIESLRKIFFTPNVAELDINGAIELKKNHIPHRLFKYRKTNEFSKENLKNSSLYCTFASTFNDPYDSTLVFDPNFGESYASGLAKQLIKKTDITPGELDFLDRAEDPLAALLLFYFNRSNDANLATSESITKLAEHLLARKEEINLKILSEFNLKIQNTYKICSLSERIDSLLMWGHYGNDHKGFAMEYDFNSLPLNDLMGRSLWPVIYSEHIYNASEIMNRANDPEKSFNNMFAIIAALHKAKDWEYEKEWRIILPDGPTSPPNNFRAPLKAVYLGSKISDADASEIYSLATAKGLPVFKMQLSQHEFKMISLPFSL
ncbi:DUF2971 domain-containing protein [Pseudomonas sp. RA_105y_Pfl2_P56]|uniref:DUF2971 domain-containing protein n=1 Tax=Pseudomonas sp. RA_105y_Pfl2_P56 TaxID=3088701 RepID=UPI0030D70480